MKKLLAIALGAVLVPVVAFSSVSALGRGQFPEGNFYYSPQNGVAVDPASLTCGNTLTLKIRAHNAGPGVVENTTVSASLPNTVATSHVSKATISSPYADPNAVSDTMTVNLDKAGKLSYVAGSAELLDSAGNKLSTLPDTLTTTGVNIGTVNVSVQEIRAVQFKVKAECETPAPKKITVCELATKQIITINEDQFDAAKHSKDLNKCAPVEPGKINVCVIATKQIVTIKENEFDAAKHTKDLNVCNVTPVTPVTPAAPQVLAATGPAETFAQIVGVTALAGAISYYVRSRRANILG